MIERVKNQFRVVTKKHKSKEMGQKNLAEYQKAQRSENNIKSKGTKRGRKAKTRLGQRAPREELSRMNHHSKST